FDRRCAMLVAAARQGDIVAGSHSSIPSIPTFLNRVRALVYKHEARRAVCYTLAASAVLALVLPLIGRVLGASRATALAVLGIAGLAFVLLVISAVVLGIIVPRRRWGGDPELARWVGGRRREVASDLLSAVELTSAPARPALGGAGRRARPRDHPPARHRRSGHPDRARRDEARAAVGGDRRGRQH